MGEFSTVTDNAFASGRAFLGQMTNAALMRAVNYRERAIELREMAAAGEDDGLDRQLLDLAKQYDALAETAGAEQ